MQGTAPTSRVKSVCETAIIVAFFAAIWLPLAGMLPRHDGASKPTAEGRALGKRPSLDIGSFESIKAFPQAFEAHYQDHFGYRHFLSQLHHRLKRDYLKVASPKVIFGTDGWLFYTHPRIIEDVMGQDPFTPSQLARWRDALEGRQAWLAERGIRYLFAIPPNKASIYPEHLPDHVRRNRGRTRLDQFMAYMRANSTVQIVDFRDDLLAAKTHHRVYFPMDTHWNARGRIYAYQRLCRELAGWFPHIQPHAMDDFEIVPFDGKGGDLRDMLGLSETRTHPSAYPPPRFERQASGEDFVLPEGAEWRRFTKNQRPRVFTNPNSHGRLLVFHDSFFQLGIKELLPEHFARSVFILCRPDYDRLRVMVEQLEPDVVIDECVERSLFVVPTEDPGFQNPR